MSRELLQQALNVLEFNLPVIEDYGSKEQLTDCHRAITKLYEELAKPEPVQVRPHEFIAMASKQATMVGTPVVWAEYPTPNKIILDEGWEWGHEARTKKAEVAKPEQITTPISPDQYERFCGKCGACLGKPWVGLTDEERHAYTQSPFTEENYRAIEAKLKELNGG